MQISFIRHGRSSHLHSRFMTAQEFQGWIQQYNEEGIIKEEEIPSETVQAVRTAKLVISSSARRAVQSAALLTGSLSFVQNPIFCEAELPVYLKMPKWMKLKPNVWTVLYRTAWLIGYNGDTESYEQAKFRAKQAADLLVGYAVFYQKVVLVGHGFMNDMIAKELRSRGWNGPAVTNHSHWGCTTYVYKKALEGTKVKQGIGFTV
jgi:broad specificity phosphatase PhoE